MLVYNKDGNMKEPRALRAQMAISDIARDLFKTLIAEGMTGLEARALVPYLTAQVDFVAVMALSKENLRR